MVEGAVPPQDLGAVARPPRLLPPQVEEGNPPGEVVGPGVPGEKRPGALAEPGDDERRGGGTQGAEHPLDVRGDGEGPCAGRPVRDPEPADLHGILEGHVLEKLELDAMGAMGETAVSLPVTTMIGPGLLADGQGGRPPEVSGVVVAQIDGLSGRIGHRVVRPGRELVLPAILRPGVAGARFRDLEPQSLVGDHVDPRGGRPLALAERDHVFAAVLHEAAQSVVELPHGTRRERLGRGPPCARGALVAPARRRGPLRARHLLGEGALAAQQDDARRGGQAIALAGRQEIAAQHEDRAPLGRAEGGSARSDQALERRLEILEIRRAASR